jgi:60 kDa SS-A/Ro ribonucleoprotein
MRSNMVAVNRQRTHEGGLARTPAAPHQLLRQVATCMLFENTFYEKGSTIADEIAETCKRVPVETIADTAIKAREDFKLRHVPLFLLAQLDQRRDEIKGLLARTVERVVQRPDELSELLSVIGKANKGKPVKKALSAQVKKGLAKAFRKFSAYQLGKWNRDNAIKLRDVLFLCHAKPKDAEQAATWKALVDGSLETPDTWEVALSAGKDKKGTWERLIREDRLGYMALLMNLRNMTEANVDQSLIEKALMDGAQGSRALPFRFVSAAKAAPSLAQSVSDAMLTAISAGEKLSGTTYLVLDVSGSMDEALSSKGQLVRWEAGAALGILLREVCQSARVFTFSNSLVEVPNLRGLALIQGVARSQPHSGTALAETLRTLFSKLDHPSRVIVVTDEQTNDGIISPPKGTQGYIVNVAAYKPALALSGGWTRVSGFSERIVDFIRWEEAQTSAA